VKIRFRLRERFGRHAPMAQGIHGFRAIAACNMADGTGGCQYDGRHTTAYCIYLLLKKYHLVRMVVVGGFEHPTSNAVH
jgi:hypothetical protein